MEHAGRTEELDLRYEQLLRSIGLREQVGREAAERLAAEVVSALLRGRAKTGQPELPLPLRQLLRNAEPLGLDNPGEDLPAGRGSEAELQRVLAGRLGEPPDRAGTIARGVLDALKAILSPKEIADVAEWLGPEQRQRWLGGPRPQGTPVLSSEPYESFMAELRASRLLEEVAPEEATRAVLGLFLHRISGEEAHRLLDELPEGVRELLGDEAPYYRERAAVFGWADLLRWVGARLALDDIRADEVTRAVFSAARLHCSEGTAERVAGQLPFELRAAWYRPGIAPMTAPEDFFDSRVERVLGHVRRSMGVDTAGAWIVTSHVVGELEHRLPGVELPWRIREVMHRCRPGGRQPPAPASELIRYLDAVAQRLGLEPDEAEAAVRAVFEALRSVLTPSEIGDVSRLLPGELRRFWRDPGLS